MKLVQPARLLIAALWVGSLWTIGYIVAPTLFASLPDRALAGTLAGKLFRIEAWLSVGCALLLLGLTLISESVRKRTGDVGSQRRAMWLIIGMLTCTLIGYFGLQPFMSALRDAAGPGGVMDSASRTQFGLLHGIASALYLVQSLLGVALILRMR